MTGAAPTRALFAAGAITDSAASTPAGEQSNGVHPLAAGFLSSRLAQTDPERCHPTQRRDAAWFLGRSEHLRAFRYSVVASDFEGAATALTQLVETDVAHEHDVTLAQLLEYLPQSTVEQYPRLVARRAFLALHTDRPAEALIWAERTQGAAFDPDALIEAQCSRVIAYWLLGDITRVVHLGRQALRSLKLREPASEQRDTFLRLATLEVVSDAYQALGDYAMADMLIRDGIERARVMTNPIAAASMPGKMAALMSETGSLTVVREYADRSLALAARLGVADHALTADAQVALGDLNWERDDLAAAEGHFRCALEVCGSPGRVWMQVRALLGLARCHVSSRRSSQAVALLRTAMGIDPRGTLAPFVRVRLLEAQVRTRLAVGDTAGARGWLLELQRRDDQPALCLELEAQFDFRGGRVDAARERIHRLLTTTRPATARSEIRRYAVIAVVDALCDDHDSAAKNVAMAVDRASADMLVRSLVEACQHEIWTRLLEQGLNTRMDDDLARSVRRAQQRDVAFGGAGRASGRDAPAKDVETLSAAERDLLQYLVCDLTYCEIAAARFVSINTVKSQLKSVYRKLGVASRVAAIEHGRALGFLAGPVPARIDRG